MRLTGEARRSLAALPENVRPVVLEFLAGGLTNDPQRVGAELQRELTGMRSARRGEYRVVYELNVHDREVIVHRVQHRRDGYRRR